MSTLTRTICTLGGLVLLGGPAAAQDVAGSADRGMLVRATPVQGPARPMQRPSAARGREEGQWHTEEFSRVVRLGAKRTFELATVVGDIVVTGGSSDDVRITAVKRVRHPNEATARAVLPNIQIRITERGGGVEVLTELPASNAATAVDYTIGLPANTNITLKTFRGAIRVSNVKGELRAETPVGDITINGAGRIRNAKAIAGNLSITDVEGEDVVAETYGGSLQLRNVKAREVEVRAVSGQITLADTQCARCVVSSISGDIELSGQLADGRYAISSQSGDIVLAPTGSVNFDLEAITLRGELQSDFRLKEGTAAAPPPGSRSLRGAYGDGSSILSLRTLNGDISVVRR